MLTCKGELEDFSAGHDLGVEDYITKPFDARLLVQRVNRAIIYTTRSDEFPRGTE
jgi:DNA-binding response OmpR family regulator